MSQGQDRFWLIDPLTRELVLGNGDAPNPETGEMDAPSAHSGTPNQCYKVTALGIANPSYEVDTDAEELQGGRGPTSGSADITKQSLEKPIEAKANLELATLGLVSLNGNGNTVGAGPYTTTIDDPSLAIEGPFSFPVVECTRRAVAATYKLMKGMAVNEWGLALRDQGIGTLTLGHMGDGTFLDGSSFLDAGHNSYLAGTRIKFGNIKHIKLGPAFEPVAKFKELEIKQSADLQTEPLPARGRFAGEFLYGRNAPSIEAEIIARGDRDHALVGWAESQTPLVCDILIEINANLSLQLIAQKARIDLSKAGGQDNLVFERNNLYNALKLPVTFDKDPATGLRYQWIAKHSLGTVLATAV